MTKREVIKSLCGTCADVAVTFGQSASANCFCDIDPLLKPDDDFNFQFDRRILDFVRRAVQEKIEAERPLAGIRMTPLYTERGNVSPLYEEAVTTVLQKRVLPELESLCSRLNPEGSPARQRQVESIFTEMLGEALASARRARR